MVFPSLPERNIDNKAKLATLCLEVNVNLNQMIMKIKMLTYSGEVSSTGEFIASDPEPLYTMWCPESESE